MGGEDGGKRKRGTDAKDGDEDHTVEKRNRGVGAEDM